MDSLPAGTEDLSVSVGLGGKTGTTYVEHIPDLLRFYVCSTFVLICFTRPAITVGTVILWALDRVRGRVLGWLVYGYRFNKISHEKVGT